MGALEARSLGSCCDFGGWEPAWFMQGFQAPAKQGGFGWVQGGVPSPAGKRRSRVEARSEPIQSRKTSIPAATCWWRCGYQPAFCSVTVGRGGEGSTWRGREAEPPQAWRCQGLGGWQPQSGCKELVLRLHVVSASALWHGVQLLELQSLGPSEPLTPSLPEPLLLKASPCCQNLP